MMDEKEKEWVRQNFIEQRKEIEGMKTAFTRLTYAVFTLQELIKLKLPDIGEEDWKKAKESAAKELGKAMAAAQAQGVTTDPEKMFKRYFGDFSSD